MDEPIATEPKPEVKDRSLREAAPYAVPLVIYLVIGMFEGDANVSYPIIYIVKVIAALAALFYYRQPLKTITFDQRWIPLGILTGLLVTVGWIGIENYLPYPHLDFLGTRQSYNPFVKITEPALLYTFLFFRFFGLILLIPVVEELFYRSFLIRFASFEDFKRLPVGTFNQTGVTITCAIFAFTHPEWLPALLTAILWAWLIRRTRSIFACVVSHAVSNLALVVYILAAKDWKFW